MSSHLNFSPTVGLQRQEAEGGPSRAVEFNDKTFTRWSGSPLVNRCPKPLRIKKNKGAHPRPDSLTAQWSSKDNDKPSCFSVWHLVSFNISHAKCSDVRILWSTQIIYSLEEKGRIAVACYTLALTDRIVNTAARHFLWVFLGARWLKKIHSLKHEFTQTSII